MKQKHISKKTLIPIIILLLVVIGLVGGFCIKTFLLDKENDQHNMSNKEAIRLISYLGVGEYEYPDRLGSSFTYKEVRKLFDAAGVSYDKSEVPISSTPGFMSISKEKFEKIYGSLVSELELDRLFALDLYIYNIDNANDKDIDGIVYEVVNTSNGDYYLEKNYSLDRSYIGKVVRVFVSNNEMILCSGESKEAVTLKNAYITGNVQSEGRDRLQCYVNGAMYDYDYSQKELITDKKNYLADIIIANEGVKEIVDHTSDLVDAKVLSYDGGILQVEGYEEPLYLSDNFNVYKTNGSFKAMKSAGTLIGYEKIKLLVENGAVEAALLEEDIVARNIRVLINDTNYESFYHKGIIITCDNDFTVTHGDKVDEYESGTQLEFQSGSKEFQDGNVKITSKEEGGRIKVTSIKRQCGSPTYRGVLELNKNDEGILVINELPVEEYLYGVVPSEMPVNYEIEALKAQAICARAYAFRQMQSDTYAKYGAHLDDSVASQVYNNVEESERTNFAVDDTYGVVPCYNDEVIQAFFFSTSCGTTSNNAYVWGGNPEAYLLDTMETELDDMADLENEETFRDFIDGKLGTDYIEADEPFFRWQVSFTKEELENVINSNLYDRIQAMPEYVLVKSSNGKFEKKSIKSVGDLESIEVTKRGPSGVILEMIITGSQETVQVLGQSNARALLSPKDTVIQKQDGASVSGWTSLPSGYFYIQEGDVTVIKGGGFGHGVGMSQNGANDLAKMGYYARDIISHYYTAVDVKDMYKMIGR